MPIPFLIAGGMLAGVFGLGEHMSAKERNERAESISKDAQNIYNNEKEALEKAQSRTENALLQLGYSKKNVLDNSMTQFIKAYEKVQSIDINQSVGLNELSEFSIDAQDVLQMQDMTDIYSRVISSGATGVAAGAVVALAASGELAIVTDVIGIAGSALAAGEVGAAVGIAGSALSFGAAMTPLGAIAAPIILFTGISASMKADENLEKAQTMYAQAEAAVEKMKISETLCSAIADRADMFNGLLNDLNGMFLECTDKLDQVIRKKEKRLKHRKLTSRDFTENDLRLLAVTGALAGAVKSIIDTPILSKDGALATESKETYDKIQLGLPDFRQELDVVRTLEYDRVPVAYDNNPDSCTNEKVRMRNVVQKSEGEGNKTFYYARWIGTILLFVLGITTLFSGGIPLAIMWVAIGLNLCPKTYSLAIKFDRWIVAVIIWLFAISFLFSGMLLLTIVFIIIGMNICPKTAAKTIAKETEIINRLKGNSK